MLVLAAEPTMLMGVAPEDAVVGALGGMPLAEWVPADTWLGAVDGSRALGIEPVPPAELAMVEP